MKSRGVRSTASPPSPVPARGLTVRQTQHHTCCLLHTTAPTRLSPRSAQPRSDLRALGTARSARPAPGAAGGRTAGAPRGERASPHSSPRLRGLALAARERRLPEWRAAERASRRCGPGGRTARVGPRSRTRGGAAAPSPRPGAEQREAAQAATGPAAARRPREAPKETPGRLSLRLGSWERPGEAPRLLTWGEDSRDPGGPGRTAEMPQTDTAAILETTTPSTPGKTETCRLFGEFSFPGLQPLVSQLPKQPLPEMQTHTGALAHARTHTTSYHTS
ncbi:translation initiation factor IF-2-like [Cricetulus griseus]|uniref:Translation initiation factor IF-2-like n=1 Tax=Cricetulus griseus TaxID=10029 RepID=A0A9J7HEL9_CRIGR|nr:translation initiation factor IF-2-like [Cricetulus griseus]